MNMRFDMTYIKSLIFEVVRKISFLHQIFILVWITHYVYFQDVIHNKCTLLLVGALYI